MGEGGGLREKAGGKAGRSQLSEEQQYADSLLNIRFVGDLVLTPSKSHLSTGKVTDCPRELVCAGVNSPISRLQSEADKPSVNDPCGLEHGTWLCRWTDK